MQTPRKGERGQHQSRPVSLELRRTYPGHTARLWSRAVRNCGAEETCWTMPNIDAMSEAERLWHARQSCSANEVVASGEPLTAQGANEAGQPAPQVGGPADCIVNAGGEMVLGVE